MKTINGLLAIAAIAALAAGAMIPTVNAQTGQDQDMSRQMQLAMDQTDFIERSIGELTISHLWSEIVMVPAGGSERITVLCGEDAVTTGGGFKLGSSDLKVTSNNPFATTTGIVGWSITVINTNASMPLPAAVDAICLSEGSSSTEAPDDDAPETSNDDDERVQTDEEESGTEVVITADGDWSGAIGDSEFRMNSVDGSGDDSIPITCESDGFYSVSIQKMEEDGELTVAVVQDGDVLKESSTTADYGVVTLSGEC